MAVIRVTHLSEDAFEIEMRGHKLLVDQRSRSRPEAGPSPVELFVGSLAACIGHYAARFLRQHDQPYQGLQVECDWAMRAGEPARVSRVDVRVVTPAPVPADLADPLRAAIEHCTVHNSLRQPPAVTIELPVPLPAG